MGEDQRSVGFFEWSDYNGSRSQGIWENVQLNDEARFVLARCQG